MATEAGPQQLRLVSKGTFNPPVSGHHLTLNPVIELTTTVGDGNVLYVWRPKDELVSKYTERNQTVSAIRWKEDGQFLAAGWSDGFVRLFGLESSKALHHIRAGDGGPAKIEFIAWSRNTTRKRSGPLLPSSRLLSQGLLVDEPQETLDLPHDLEFIEIETALPKLSPLPVSGGTGDDMFVFSTTSSLDFVFRPCKAEDANTVHVMTVGTADGGIHLSIYDSFIIGTFRPSPITAGMTAPARGSFHLCGHGFHPDISTHSLLLRPQDDSAKLYVLPMDLTFIHDSPINLSLLASKTTTLQNLLRYLKQTQSHMAGEFKSSRELPNRFILGVQEDLQKMERGPITIVQALCHTVTTGDVFPPMKEWLLESLTERGHKRWDKAVVSGLQNLRALVHENFLPALERCGVILSRLLGIARFHEARETIGFTVVQIRGLMDMVSCLTVIARNILANVMDELDYFSAFSVWLRMEIDKLVSPSTSDELSEKEVTMDHAKVMTYIQRYLISSPLALYFDDFWKAEPTPSIGIGAETGSGLLDLLDEQIRKHDAGLGYNKGLPNVACLVDHLVTLASTVFRGIAEAERRGVRFGQATEISVGEKIWKHDIHVCAKTTKDHPDIVTFTAVVPGSDKKKVNIFRATATITNGISGDASVAVTNIGLPDSGTIVDMKFLDDTSLLVLSRQKGPAAYVLLRADYQSSQLSYTASSATVVTAVKDGIWTTLGFSDMTAFVPIQMEVQKSSSARGEIAGRVCLLGRDNAAYRTYALPEDWDVGGELEQEGATATGRGK
ncbi:anaphase-promoting complex, cyclosome, subunit 4-domain-containing protein [Rhypophila decipiens]|uniref:Anaphase-promoting complex subunit 4 n=1 Tax=Rhypophila decipiens TaxID=261697 RepID=A0AAN6YJY6_9PEZI|nr:anaphase-promoting complex, cyclosome, subunit 4-domain-containing protein [Rhypophila decipiens]